MATEFEEYDPNPYHIVILTVRYGYIGSGIIPTKTYTKVECEDLLEKGLAIIVKAVNSLIKVNIPDYTRATLYWFTYNVGTGGSRSCHLKNSMCEADPCNELKRWIYSRDVKWKGVMTIRDVEKVIYLGKFAYAYPLSLLYFSSTLQLAYMCLETIPVVLIR